MSAKKKRMREKAVEDACSGLEESTRDCQDLADLIDLIQKKQKKGKKAMSAASEKEQKVVQSNKAVPETVSAADVKCATSPAQKKKRNKNKATKVLGNTSSATNVSQKQVENNELSKDIAQQSKERHIQTSLKTESTSPVLQSKKKRKKQKANVKNKASQELNTCQSNNNSNGQVEVEKNVITISDHSVFDPLLDTPEFIDLTEDIILEDPYSLEPYNKDEITSAQVSMEYEKSHAPLNWFLQRLKIRNTASKFVPRTSNMENEYYGLQDDFPMPSSS